MNVPFKKNRCNILDMTNGIFFTNKKNIFLLIQDDDYIYEVTIPDKAIVCVTKENNNLIDKYKTNRIILECEINLEELRIEGYEISYKYNNKWSHQSIF